MTMEDWAKRLDLFLEFDERAHRFLDADPGRVLEYFAEVKFDGLSINLTYEDGVPRPIAPTGN